MSAAPHVVVVGAGIVGVCAAWHLARRGLAVSLIDRDEPGRGCSYGNAGAISSGSVAPLAMPGVVKQAFGMLFDPTAPLHVPLHYWLTAAPWLIRFVQASRPAEVERIATALGDILAHSIERHREMLRAAGAPELVEQTGQLHLYRDDAQLAKDAATWELRRRHGVRVERLRRAQFLELEPDIGADYEVGLFTPEQGMSINPYRQVTVLAEDFARRGGTIVRDQVRAIEVAGDRITGVRGEGGSYPADHIVLAAGAWSARLLEPLGYDVPLETQRGYHVTVRDPGIALRRPVVAADRKVFITPMETGLRVAGTVEFGGLERPPTRRRAELLVRHLAGVFPRARIPDTWEMWMGHRPCLPDSLPVLGPSPRHRGLWFDFGHGHLGLTMSAGSGEHIARRIAGEPSNLDLAAFSIERFERRRGNAERAA